MECIDHDDELDLSSLVDKTRNINVPIGHIIAAHRWKNSELHHTLQSKITNKSSWIYVGCILKMYENNWIGQST